MYLLYAYNDMDPTSEEAIPQHQFRQSIIINLFGSIVEPPPPQDVTFLDLRNENVIQSIHFFVIRIIQQYYSKIS